MHVLPTKLIPKQPEESIFGSDGLAANFESSLAPCSRTMPLAPDSQICAASLPNSRFFKLFRYTLFLMSSFCFHQSAFCNESALEEPKEHKGLPFAFPLFNSVNRLIQIDLELSFIYMQRNWERVLNGLNVVYGPNPPDPTELKEDDPEILEPDPEPNIECNYCVECYCCCHLEKIASTISVRHIESGGLGYKSGYTTLEGLFFPSCSDLYRWAFLDIRGHFFNNNAWAGNVGLGARFLNPCTTVTYGMNFYFDWRISHHHNSFYYQYGIGFERLSECWEWHLNGYFAPTNKKKIRRRFFIDETDFLVESTKWEIARAGIDFEIGANLIHTDYLKFYTGIGPYFYDKAKHNSSFYGGRVRALLKFKQNLSFEAIATYDRKFKAKYQGMIALHFPFGGSPKRGSCQEVVSRPVWRNEIILFNHYVDD